MTSEETEAYLQEKVRTTLQQMEDLTLSIASLKMYYPMDRYWWKHHYLAAAYDNARLVVRDLTGIKEIMDRERE